MSWLLVCIYDMIFPIAKEIDMQHSYTKDELAILIAEFNEINVEYAALNTGWCLEVATMRQSKKGNWIFEIDGVVPNNYFCLKTAIKSLKVDLRNERHDQIRRLRFAKIKEKVRPVLTKAEFNLLVKYI